MSKHWLPYVAVAVALAMALPAFSWEERPRLAIVFSIVLMLCVAAIRAFRSRRLGGKYDLGELRRVVEEDELGELREREVPVQPDNVLCLCCGEAYDARLKVCPNCKRGA
jgi:hypothetical protein